MSEERQLTGHAGALRLAAVPGDDGRTRLVSTHRGGAVRVWDPWTGERVAGPLRLGEGEEAANDLAVARLGPEGGATVSRGDHEISHAIVGRHPARWCALRPPRSAP